MAPAAVSVGFGKADLSPHLPPGPGFRRPLEANACAIEAGDGPVLLVSLDLIGFSAGFCAGLQARVAGPLGLAPERVLLHTTHTHSAPWEQDVGSRLSIHRRGDAGDDLGVQTFWYGYRFRSGDDRPDASALVTEMTARWRNEPPRYEDGPRLVFFDRPVDPFVHVAHFEREDGRPLGDQVLAFLHSEVAVETTLGLRAEHPQTALWTVSLTGGTIEYLPTAEMLDEGGYEGRSALIRRDAEARLRAHLSGLIAEVAPAG